MPPAIFFISASLPLAGNVRCVRTLATIEIDFIWYGTRVSPPVPAMIAFTLLALAALWRGWALLQRSSS
jgi:hypothetical protein